MVWMTFFFMSFSIEKREAKKQSRPNSAGVNRFPHLLVEKNRVVPRGVKWCKAAQIGAI
jgi:hypothetical protein